MVKSDHPEIWSQDMGSDIKPVLTILDDRMIKLEIWGGVKNKRENDNPSP